MHLQQLTRVLLAFHHTCIDSMPNAGTADIMHDILMGMWGPEEQPEDTPNAAPLAQTDGMPAWRDRLHAGSSILILGLPGKGKSLYSAYCTCLRHSWRTCMRHSMLHYKYSEAA